MTQGLVAPEQDSRKIILALKYLRRRGMDQELLRDLHHSEKRRETYSAAVAYRQLPPVEGYREPNLTYHQRLLFVAAEHWRTGASFTALVRDAQVKFYEPQA